jgi:hypothetical protein
MPFGWADFQSRAAGGPAPQQQGPPVQAPGAPLPGQGFDPQMLQMLMQQAQYGQTPQGGPGQAMVPPNFDNQLQAAVPQPPLPPPGAPQPQFEQASVPPGFDNQVAPPPGAPAAGPPPQFGAQFQQQPPPSFGPAIPGLPGPPPLPQQGSTFDPQMMQMLMAQFNAGAPPQGGRG